MFDETNNTEAETQELPEKLFEEDEQKNDEISNENHIIDDTGSEMLKIKYNGEEREITLDEARVLAQKGMNYDHVLNERDTRYKRELDFLDRVAAENGLSRADLIAAYDNPESQNEEVIRGVVSDASARAREQVRRLSESAGFNGPWKALFTRYPDLSRKDAYSELEEGVQSGMTPLEAYQEKLLTERENALKIARNNDATARRSVGSLDGDGGAEALDDFLTGFYSV